MEKKNDLQKLSVRSYFDANPEKIKCYVNAEEMTIVGKAEVVTKLGRKVTKLVYENQYGDRKYMSPETFLYFYKESSDGTYKPRQEHSGDYLITKCIAAPYEGRPVSVCSSDGERRVVQSGDFLLMYKLSNGNERVRSMDLLEFAHTFKLHPKEKLKTKKTKSENSNEI